MSINETHDMSLRSWVPSANTATTDFPIQNLPFAVFTRKHSQEPYRGGVAIGDQVLDLAAVYRCDLFPAPIQHALQDCCHDNLNGLMSAGASVWSALRLALSRALREGAKEAPLLQACLIDQADVQYQLPCRIGDYTDFYTSIHHATAVGKLFRPDNPLLPNYQWVPIAYHGRASSIGISGQCLHRPVGQQRAAQDAHPAPPLFAPSQRLDYEVEMGVFIGQSNALGQAIPIDNAEDHVFGVCLLNDWSARDIQAWEYQPLGPFLSKNFGTTLSPWIVTMEALAPFKEPWHRDAEAPDPLPYLDSADNRRAGAFNIQLECLLSTEQLRQQHLSAVSLSIANFRHSYWTISQMVTHHTVGGCNLRPGDLLGTGTQSGPHPSEAGSLLELTGGGKHAITLPNGETRTFLQDGDTITLRGWCEKTGVTRIGFGECQGTILPAIPSAMESSQ